MENTSWGQTVKDCTLGEEMEFYPLSHGFSNCSVHKTDLSTTDINLQVCSPCFQIEQVIFDKQVILAEVCRPLWGKTLLNKGELLANPKGLAERSCLHCTKESVHTDTQCPKIHSQIPGW